MMENLKLWNKVKETDPKYTKPAKIGGLKITAIAPQYQIMLATEQFGPYGVGFGFKSIELDYNLIERFNLVVFKGVFFYPNGQFEIINSSKMFMDRAQEMVDADFAKKIETDALTKALSKIGFNADVFMGRFDDTKYVLDMTEKHREPTADEQSWIDAVNRGDCTADDITGPSKDYIKGLL
tara:strand:+ start:909 stop:1451 length:543 start_codon:yes stop_codon:yes gene_type:complete